MCGSGSQENPPSDVRAHLLMVRDATHQVVFEPDGIHVAPALSAGVPGLRCRVGGIHDRALVGVDAVLCAAVVEDEHLAHGSSSRNVNGFPCPVASNSAMKLTTSGGSGMNTLRLVIG